jgi:hypothetical protein
MTGLLQLEKRRREKKYRVEYRRRGLFRQLPSRNLTFQQALAAGVGITKGTLASTFRAVPTGYTETTTTPAATRDVRGTLAREFQPLKQPQPLTYTQKPQYRLGTKGEVSEIQRAAKTAANTAKYVKGVGSNAFGKILSRTKVRPRKNKRR